MESEQQLTRMTFRPTSAHARPDAMFWEILGPDVTANGSPWDFWSSLHAEIQQLSTLLIMPIYP